MKALSKIFLPIIATLALAGCGGGSGGSSGAAFEPPLDIVAVSAASTSITTNNYTTLIVSVKKQDGTAEADGTAISASVSPASLGSVSGGGANATAGASATSALSGGTTTFIFSSATNTGTATVNISLPPIGGNPNSVTTSVSIAISAGNGIDPRLQLVASATTLPVSPYDFGQQQTSPFPGDFLGSPYISEIAVTWRHSNGQLVTGTSSVNVSIAPTTVAGFSILSTAGSNQFTTILGSGPVQVTGGVGTIYVHASNIPGTAVLTVTAVDPDHGNTITSQLTITVAGATSNKLPGAVTISQAAGGVYVSGSNGAQSKLVSATVTDGNGALVADPNDGQGHSWDNVQFSIVGPSGTDAQLSAVNAAGTSQTGSTVVTTTHNGVASVTFQAGTQQGPVQVKATVDRGDNNVDNGIQDPVSATASVIVSDGKLFNLTLTVPGSNTNDITVNGVSTSATSSSGTGVNSDGTYSLALSVQGQDRQGNPVLPGTEIKFGEIDAPLNPYTGAGAGQFSITGGDGNPAVNGTLFTSASGHFTTAGGGAGPGDTLLVFGKLVTGDRDLENVRLVQHVNSATSLNVATNFNANDDTGVSVPPGPVLPYIVGRGQDGNITSSATTNDVGVATVALTYPVSKLGKLAAVWAQGSGSSTTNPSKTVDDILLTRFAGVAAISGLTATVTASPNPIYGNTTQAVSVCIVDALGSPVQGIQFSFQFSGQGTGSVDGVAGSGSLSHLTDASGCAPATAVTSGVPPTTSGTTGSTFQFCTGSLCATLNVVVNLASLQVSPSAEPVPTGTVSYTILVTAKDTLGNSTPGVVVTVACSASGGAGASLTPVTPVTTGSGGTANDVIVASGFVDNTAIPPAIGVGSCVFSAPGVASATVIFTGSAVSTSP